MEANREVSVKLRGRRFRVSHDEANQVLKDAGISAHGINRGKAPSYFLVVDGRKIPIKQALKACLLYTSPSPRDRTRSRMPSSA